MKKILLPLFALAVLSCSVRESSVELTQLNDGVKVTGLDVPSENLIEGAVNVLVSEELASELEKHIGEDGVVNVSGTRLAGAGVRNVRRVFPDAGKFEARHREYGLHLWYAMEYDSSVSVTKAAGDISSIAGIEEVEFPVKIRPVGISDEITYVTPSSAMTSAASVFNDPQLSRQWNYYNDGSASSSASGCDINVVPVWKNYSTGSSDVIVAVFDTGVDYAHEDLAANMWHNPEQSGDSRYGKNFVTGAYVIHPEDHGTHVAGTIAAVNNNGKGVCGIAGGDAAKRKPGVKIMSCQIFDGQSSAGPEKIAEALTWACDNGAIISQNSWGLTTPSSMSGYLASAVRYFTDNAGLDPQDKLTQTGPIRGGLVIFAAGNDEHDRPHGTYLPGYTINVASVGADYRKAYYSNYGDWVDITATGGDTNKGNQILSTLPENKYGYMQGTSMACPHVSGVAALLISAKKGKDVTNTTIKKLLLENVTDISSFNPNYKMGSGLVNCYKAMAGSDGKAPDVPTELAATSFSNNVYVSVKIPSDADDGVPTSIAIYYSKSSITSTKSCQYAMFYVGDKKAGETLTGTLTGLDFNCEYYLAAEAVDLAGHHSKTGGQITVSTGANIPPKFIPHGAEISFKGHENPKLEFVIENPAKHYCSTDSRILYNVERTYYSGIVIDTLDGSGLTVRFYGSKLKDNSKGTVVLMVEDAYGAGDTCEVKFTVEKNHAPYIAKKFENMIFNSRNDEPLKFTASDYFKDDDGETLSYEIELDGPSINFVYGNGSFILTPMDYGYTNVKVTGKDVREEKVSQSFRTLVRNSSLDVEVYPNPVTRYLYLRSSDKEKTASPNARVKIVSATGQTYYDSDLSVTAFEPGVVDMGTAGPGSYTVTVDYTSASSALNTYKFNIVKL